MDAVSIVHSSIMLYELYLGCFTVQNVPKPGHKRTDSTHSSNESEYTFSSEFAEMEDIAPRTEVCLSLTKNRMFMFLLIGRISNNWLMYS